MLKRSFIASLFLVSCVSTPTIEPVENKRETFKVKVPADTGHSVSELYNKGYALSYAECAKVDAPSFVIHEWERDEDSLRMLIECSSGLHEGPDKLGKNAPSSEYRGYGE